jgi:hypothetical protein
MYYQNDYVLCHVSFQSTGGMNISSVNELSSVELYVWERRKGRGVQERRWEVEMNEARKTYLKNYSAIDKIDQTLLGWNLSYRSWRWWHAPTRHAKAIAMSMAYSLYLQCLEDGVLVGRWLLFLDQGFGRNCNHVQKYPYAPM